MTANHKNNFGYQVSLAILFFFTFFAPIVKAANYYVATNGSDTNSGTLSSPWKTISKAANTLVAGDTVHIRAGTYKEQIIPKNSGSAAGGFITYAAYAGETVTIDATGVLGWAWAGIFQISNRSHLQISGIQIFNSAGFGMLIRNSTNLRILNNYTNNSIHSGIYVENGDDITIDGNEVAFANIPGASQESISIVRTHNFIVSNNRVHGGGKEGIDAKVGSSNGKIFGNIVYNMSRIGIYIDAWDASINNIEIYNNTVYNSKSADSGAGEDAIRIGGEKGGNVSNIKIYNNILYNIAQSGIRLSNWTKPGFNEPQFSNISIYNNTIYNTGIKNIYSAGVNIQGSQNSNITIRNNIFSNAKLINIQASSSTTISNNLFDGGSVSGANAVVDSPLFMDAANNDFHLQSTSPAINAGFLTDAPTTDFDLKVRSADGQVDIGAFEYILSGTPAPTPSPTPVPVVNLLINGGFESGMNSWNNWGNASAVASDAVSGSYSIRVGKKTGGIGQQLTHVSGRSYKLQFSGKVSDSAGARVGIQYLNSAGINIGEVSVDITSSSYSVKTFSVNPVAGTAKVQVYLWKNSGKGYLYVDDISLLAQ